MSRQNLGPRAARSRGGQAVIAHESKCLNQRGVCGALRSAMRSRIPIDIAPPKSVDDLVVISIVEWHDRYATVNSCIRERSGDLSPPKSAVGGRRVVENSIISVCRTSSAMRRSEAISVN
jgi:hypothetical protein